MKKALSVILALVMVFALCASFASAETKEITYVTLGDTGLDVLQEAAVDFEAETGIKVNFESWSYSDAYSKILTLAEAGDMPDAMYGFSSWTEQFQKAGWSLPIDDYCSAELVADFTDSAREVCSVDGKMWAMPSWMSIRTMVVNGDAFEAAGLEIPTTWDELLADAPQLMGGTCQYAYTMVAGHAKNTADCFLPILWAYGADILSEDHKTVAFNTDAGVAALQMYVDLAQYAVPDYGEAIIANTLANFESQLAACHLHGAQGLSDLKNEGKDYSWAKILTPLQGPTGEAYSYGVMDVDLLLNTENAEATAKWLEFWHQEKYMGRVLAQYGWIPNQMSFYEENANYLDPENDMVAPFAAMVDMAKFKPTITCWEEIQKIMSDYTTKAVFGQMTAADAWAAAEKECNEVLAAQ